MTKKTLHIALLCLMALFAVSCSTKKNTGMTRFWHGFTAHYNTYYNGTVAYIDGSLEKEKGNKDNYTEQIPLYTVGNKASRDLGKSNYETAITKAKKAIQVHSIKAKPEWTKERKKTEKDIEWLSRKEYNPFIWKAWMLMGRSQFYQGNFDEAASTFNYMSRLFRTQPAIYGKARAWLAKCYIENGWIYDAEDVIRNMERDSIHWTAQKEWDYTYCDYYLHTENLPMATKYLRRVIKHEMRKKQKAREYYLLGQIEAAQGHRKEAYDAFRKVVRQNPPYELEFNARISMTEVMAQGQSRQMIGKLKRMARNDNNKEYLDQVYYAIGNIYLAEKDTANAIAAYEKGNEKATRSGIEKGVLLLHLGDLYWQKEKYGDAKRCYGEAIGMLDKDRDDYEQLSMRSKVLDELVPFTDAIELQDSLQELSRMSEKDRNAAIDRVIDALKKKEKEEAKNAAEAEIQKKQAQNGSNNRKPQAPLPNAANRMPGQQAVWYFYNPTTVQQGKQTFERTWGKRENTDDWRRVNRTVVGSSPEVNPDADTELTDEQRDSLVAVEKKQEAEKQKMDSAVNDPHKREYYLAQIPFTEEALAASDEIIKDGLFHSAVIFKDKLDNLPLSEKQFKRLTTQYPDFAPKDETYYHLFLLYSRKGEHDTAATYIEKLKEECPESKWTAVLTDSYFADNAKFGKHLEDSIYGATYDAFKADRFEEVYANAEMTEKRFPLGENRDRFIFLEGMTRLNNGDMNACLEAMQRVVKEYPQSSVAQMAGMIINGVQAGRQLHGAKFDLSDVWNRRNAVMTDADSIGGKALSPERNTDFLFVMAYMPDSVSENKLLFQLARYNFTSFLVRNFDITIENAYGMHHMIVSGFRNFDEARQYGTVLMKQENVKQAMGKARPMIISTDNISLIGTRYSYNDYDTFYVKNFAPLMVQNAEMLYEPVQPKEKKEEVEREDPIKPALPTEEVAPGGAKPVDPKKEEDSPTDAEDLLNVPSDTEIAEPSGTEIAEPSDTEITVPADTEITVPADTEITVPADTEISAPAATEITVPADTEIAIPADTEITVPSDTEISAPAATEITIPATVPDVSTSGSTTETFLFEDADTSTGSEDDGFILDDGSADEGSQDNGETIEIDDRESSEGIEDEYLELDGF